jgi:hypothetical protein
MIHGTYLLATVGSNWTVIADFAIVVPCFALVFESLASGQLCFATHC